MAEAATVLQLIQFSGMVLSACYEYINKARSANNDIEKIHADVSGLENILKRLASLISSDDVDRHTLLRLLGRPSGPFDACSKALSELQRKLKALTEASSARRRILWPLEEGKIRDILARLSEQKQTFILALVADEAENGEKDARQGREVAIRLDDINDKEERSRILSWLHGADPSTNYNAARRKHEKGTGDWLLHLDQFRAWKGGDGGSMWISGIPGAGKTILSSTVIEHLSTQHGSHAEHRIFYYFFDFNDPAKQTAIGCLRSLVEQLCAQSTTLPECITHLHETCKGKAPSMGQLVAVLIKELGRNSNDFIIIDALDECREQVDRERNAFFGALTNMKDAIPGKYKLLITSREESDIREAMATIANVVLEVKGDGVRSDICAHVTSYIDRDIRMKKWPQNVKDVVIQELGEKANGMFRWVFCQLESLRTCLKPNLSSIRRKLNDLPTTLDETYERIFLGVNEDYAREMRIILTLLAFSVRPMTIQEIAEATAINLQEQKFDIEDRFPDPYDVLELCSSIVSLVDLGSNSGAALLIERGPSASQWMGATKIIQFAHFTVKEFILSERAYQKIPPTLQIVQEVSHKEITELCLVYLLDFNGGKRADKTDHDAFPLLAYSALHWTTHMAHVTSKNANLIQELLIRLFDPDESDSLMNFLNLYDPASLWTPYGESKSVTFSFMMKRNKQDFETPLFYAAYYGLLDISQWLTEEGSETGQNEEKLGPALGAAAAQGHFEIAKMLLEQGADPNSPYCGRYFRPLHAAAGGGNAEIVKLLLGAGADVNTQGGEYGTVLHLAAKQGNPEIVQLFLDAGCPVSIRHGSRGTPLFLAARHGNEEALSILLQHGADVHVSAGEHLSPLIAACRGSSLRIVKLLLDAGTELNVPNASQTALHEAAERPDLDIMRLLISNGADPNAHGGTYGTPLKGAIQSRELESFQFMLDCGADINECGSTSYRPVDQAIFGGNIVAAERLLQLGAAFTTDALKEALDYHKKEHLVPLLLERGADPNATVQEEEGNLLQFAIMRSSTQSIKMLLEAGADVDAVEGRYGTALQAACVRKDIEMVHLVLEHGAIINTEPYGEYGSALQAAAYKQQKEIVELLLDKGADVNAIGGRYQTALQAVADTKNDDPTIVRMLLEKGANVNIVGGEHGSALRAALSNGVEEISKLMLRHGAHILLQQAPTIDSTTPVATKSSKEYDTILEVAISSGKPSIIQILLDHGFDIDADAKTCELGLWSAAILGESTMLKYLIEKGIDVKRHGGHAVHAAINRRRAGNFELLLQHGADVNWRRPTPSKFATGSALEEAVASKQRDIMRRLLHVGVDVNTQCNSKHGTPLQAAIEAGDKDAFMELLERGAHVDFKAGYCGTAATWAAYKGEEDMLQELIRRGANVNCNHGYYGNPLQAAIAKDYTDIAHWLLDHGADPTLPGLHPNALIGACSYGKPGQIALVRRLVSLGCDLDVYDEERAIDQDEIAKRLLLSPLSNAARSGNVKLVELLLEAGANINASGGSYGTPLAFAAHDSKTDIARCLISKGADVNLVGGEYGTALQAAAYEVSDETIKVLLDGGADVNTEGGYFGTALQASSLRGIQRHVKLFLESGALVNTKTGKFGNALQAAAKAGKLNIVRLLVESYGADVNSQCGKYGTALQAACCDTAMNRIRVRDGTAIVTFLLIKGAQVNAVGGKYGTALQAAAYHHVKFVEVLLKYKADPNIKNGKFGSALKAAQQKKLYRTVKLLKQYGADETF